jgi:hypothetical protein
MSDDIIKTDYALQQYCEAAARDIFDEADDKTDTDAMFDRAHENADWCEHVIYYHRALQICANCNTDQGEEFLQEAGMPETVTFNGLATIIAYGEIRARIEVALQELISEHEEA